MRGAFFGFIAQRFQGRVKEFVDEPIEGSFDLFPRADINFSQLVHQPLQLVILQVIGLLPEPLNGGGGHTVIAFGHEAKRFFLHNTFCFGPFFLTRLAVLFADGLQIIDAVQVNVAELGDLRVKIAGDGQIEHEQQSLAMRAVRWLETARR